MTVYGGVCATGVGQQDSVLLQIRVGETKTELTRHRAKIGECGWL
jgi:hypothetical protein